MLVQKFGGTSVGTPDAIKKLIDIVGKPRGEMAAVVVVSAFSGVTDDLIALANLAGAGDKSYESKLADMRRRHYDMAAAFLSGAELQGAGEGLDAIFGELSQILGGIAILKEVSPRSLDHISGFGEQLSASLIAAFFRASGIDAEYLDSRHLIKTDNNYGKARVLTDETYKNIQNHFKNHKKLQIAAGFIGSTAGGSTTTLGRGGSDLTAAIYGAALDAEMVEIWTDVDGILTGNPKLVKTAFSMDYITYHEAMEMSHFGAKVLHPPTVQPLLKKNIPIWIRNTFNPSGKGTIISKEPDKGNWPIRGISSLSNVALVRVQGTGMFGVSGFSSRLFGALASRKISVILISQASSEYSICFAVTPQDAEGAVAAINEEFVHEIDTWLLEKPMAEMGLSVIAVVGSRMKSSSGISGKVFHALGRNGVNVVAIAQGSSEINISAVVAREDEAKALNAIHEAFFLSGVRSVNLFLVGLGLIGGTLLKQIGKQRDTLANRYQIRINLIGAANSRAMVFDTNGVDPEKVKTLLENGAEPFNIDKFVAKMTAANLPNSCFCDCTASEDVAAAYEKILHSAISIVTPNKKANSGSLDYYKRLTGYSRDRGIPYIYEVTVAAGLPVISTLRDLHLSGDRVLKIEAVLSGTLSFIFNNFDGSKTFSALVREAKAKGYTEPDPRDDLNAMDAARKALILARECGMPLEFSQVQIDHILPPSCFEAKNVEDFFKELEKADADFEKKRSAAEKEGKALRYTAVIEAGAAQLSMSAESETSPFRSLVDSENIVVITTERYNKLPLVVKGPGAGAEVTAGGVFADIVRIARTMV